jgi:hypothetical protein
LASANPAADRWEDAMVADRLVRIFAAAGLVVGLAGAALWHWARQEVGGFTVFAPLNDQFTLPTHHPGWWPSALIFVAGGLLIGTATGFTLARFGWTMTRSPRHRA